MQWMPLLEENPNVEREIRIPFSEMRLSEFGNLDFQPDPKYIVCQKDDFSVDNGII